MLTNGMKQSTHYPKDLRIKWYRLVEAEDRSVNEVCRLYGIPKKTYYKWYARDHGQVSRRYRRSAPQPATKLTPAVRRFIETTKAKTNYGPAKMQLALQRELGLTLSTTLIYRYYRRTGLIRRPQKRLPWYAPMKDPLRITAPGVGAQLDVKYVYDGGVRAYQFSVVDPYTRRGYARVFATKHSINAVTVLKEAEAYFGLAIHSVQTDNGSEFRGAFHRWCTEQDVPHYFIPKSSPAWNGIVERWHRTVDDEYYQNPERSWHTLAAWLTYYNEERLHLALGGLTPLEQQQLSVTP